MLNPDHPKWHSQVESALELADVDAHNWHRSTDVVVVGFGGAGACAALEAREQGAEVIAVDRYEGGGATNMSGGVVYQGGGTQYQKANGFEDTPEQMFRYLKKEVEDAVSDDTLKVFCEQSVVNGQWLESNGVKFSGSLSPVKTSYPTQQYYYYYSGNEQLKEYAAEAAPVPRGHRAVGPGMSGSSFYQPLKRSALAKGVEPMLQSRVVRLVMSGGRVVGVEVERLPEGTKAQRQHQFWNKVAIRARVGMPPLLALARRRMKALEQRFGERFFIRARQGVVLSAGGFAMNAAMIKNYASKYQGFLPLGDTGCNGEGIRLGQSVGGATDRMERISVWRFINPPQTWVRGIIVNKNGERYCNEQAYGAKIGYHMVEENDGYGMLILSEKQYRQALRDALPDKVWLFQTGAALLASLFGTTKARSLDALAAKLVIPADTLTATVADYNRGARGEQEDTMGKSKDFLAEIDDGGKYYAVNLSMDDNAANPLPGLSVGGLVVDERTGAVKNTEGESIEGLYAAGRTAVGLASHLYVSGLSISDCMFSGRRAGRHMVTGESLLDG